MDKNIRKNTNQQTMNMGGYDKGNEEEWNEVGGGGEEMVENQEGSEEWQQIVDEEQN